MAGETWQRVWICQDVIAAQAAVGVLEDAGIPVRLRDLSLGPYPVSLGPLSERHLEVPAADAAEALGLLRTAVRDGILNPA